MINYIKGDLFKLIDWQSPTYKIIPHCCNNINSFGSGFAAAVAKQIPEVKQHYHAWFSPEHRSLPPALGRCGYVPLPKQFGKGYFVNMIGQNGVRGRDNPLPVDYKALEDCVKNVGDFVQYWIDDHPIVGGILADNREFEIHTVKFGAGLAGGEWNVIEKMIIDHWVPIGCPINVYYL